MPGEYFHTPGVTKTIKGIWPWFWGFSKLLWPVWVFIAILAIIKYGGYFLGKKIDQKMLERTQKKCPDCTERALKEARKCNRCGTDF